MRSFEILNFSRHMLIANIFKKLGWLCVKNSKMSGNLEIFLRQLAKHFV